MRAKIPAKLYKYYGFTARTLTALKSRTVWFGKPSAFNDPFDCDVPLRFVPFSMSDVRRVIADRSPDGWSALRKDPGAVDESGRATESLRASLEASAQQLVREERGRYFDELGVTCFSERPDILLMWSHYGNGHRGVCLEFDTSSELLQRLHRVQYVDNVPAINLRAMLLHDSSQVLAGLLTKAACWSYEREWRAIHKTAGTEYCYGVEALTGVYLGAALSDVERDVVGQLLHGTPTKLYTMERSPASFAVQARNADYTPYVHPAAP